MIKQQSLDALFKDLDIKTGTIELLLESERGSAQRLAKEMSRLGEVNYVFTGIPYISMVCERSDARVLASWMYRDTLDTAFYKSFREGLSLIQSIEKANTVSAIPTVPVKNSYPRPSEHYWNLAMVGAYDAQEKTKGEGAKIAIIDTGVDYYHKELSQRFGSNKGYDFVKGDDDPMDMFGHGTHVAGIAAGDTVGIAKKATLYSVRVLDENGSGSESTVMAGIEWAANNGCDVANLSLGSPIASQAFEEMCAYAASKGLIIIAAAGNNGQRMPSYPAAFDSVVSVAAIDESKNKAEFSNWYPTMDIAAPGVNIVSSFPEDRYRMFNGTSMASPHVSGVAALLVSIGEKGNAIGYLGDSAEQLGDGSATSKEYFGAGLVRADKAVNRAPEKGTISNIGRKMARAVAGAVW